MINNIHAKDIRISICIPQYNRVEFLIESLKQIAKQDYQHIEISISDDCSSDDTETRIRALMASFKYPILYERFSVNQGYDRNLRRAMEMASGDYIIILGNDDTINPDYSLVTLVKFIIDNDYPDIGFTNFISAKTLQLFTRAHSNGVLGHGPDIACTYYSCFSFIGGVIIRRDQFMKYNTSAYDGSIFVQMYFSTVIISCGGRLFSIYEPVVIKDILPDQEVSRVSYLDRIPRRWKDYKQTDGGIPSVIAVVISGFIAAHVVNQRLIYRIFRKIYTTTFPYWIVDYRRHSALPAAVGLVVGMSPRKARFFTQLTFLNKIKIYIRYFTSASTGLLIPFRLYDFIVKNYFKKTAEIE